MTLPDGSTTQALVPQVYVAVKTGDLNSNGQLLSGALISANSINLNITGDLNNSNGTIAGRTVLALNANNINNLGGRLTANDVNVHANNDLNNLGGSIDAQHSLIASAGHDLNVITSTSTQSNATGSRTNINRVAGLYVTGIQKTEDTGQKTDTSASLILSAGHDLHLDGAQIMSAAGNTSQTILQAGHDLSLGIFKTFEQNNITWNSKNHLNQGSSIDNGTQIQSNGDITLNAGHDANLKAASIESGNSNAASNSSNTGGKLAINAANSINITTGQASQNFDEAQQLKSKQICTSVTTYTCKLNGFIVLVALR